MFICFSVSYSNNWVINYSFYLCLLPILLIVYNFDYKRKLVFLTARCIFYLQCTPCGCVCLHFSKHVSFFSMVCINSFICSFLKNIRPLMLCTNISTFLSLWVAEYFTSLVKVSIFRGCFLFFFDWIWHDDDECYLTSMDWNDTKCLCTYKGNSCNTNNSFKLVCIHTYCSLIFFETIIFNFWDVS